MAARTCGAIGFPFVSVCWTPRSGPIATMLSNDELIWNNYCDHYGAVGSELTSEYETSLQIALRDRKQDTQQCQSWKTKQSGAFRVVADAPTAYFLTDYQSHLPRVFNHAAWQEFFAISLCQERDRSLLFIAKTQDFVTNQMDADIRQTLDAFAHGYRYLYLKSLDDREDLSRSRQPTPLSRREVECLCWLASGKTIFEAATILGISERTLRFHISNARERLGVSTTVQAIVAAAFAYGFDPHDGRRSIYAMSRSQLQ